MSKVKGFFITVLTMFVLVACAGKEDLIGTWKAQSPDGQNVEIVITEDTISVDGEEGKYTRTGKGFENNVNYITVEVEGTDFTIIFPEDDKNIAMMIAPESSDDPLYGTLYFAMHKNEQPDYQEYAEKYMQQ